MSHASVGAASVPFPATPTYAMIRAMHITIHGIPFLLPDGFLIQAGHVCSESDAKTLQSTKLTNIRNNISRRIQAMPKPIEGEALTALRAEVADYAAKYTFSATTMREKPDPVMLEAGALARVELKTRARAAGVELSPAQLESQVLVLLTQNPEFRVRAQRLVAARQAIAAKLWDED